MFFSQGRVVLYTVFMASPLPRTLVRTLVRTLAKNLVKILVKNLVNNLVNTCSKILPIIQCAVYTSEDLSLYSDRVKRSSRLVFVRDADGQHVLSM